MLKEDKWIPDFSSRYFTADFSYGLKVIRDIANVFEVDVSNLEEVWNWYLTLTNTKEFFH